VHAESNPSDDRSIAILENDAGDATLQELAAALRSFNNDETAELLALLRLGRGDCARDDWAGALEQTRGIGRDEALRRLVGTPMLGDLLEEGLASCGYSCSDLEEGHL